MFCHDRTETELIILDSINTAKTADLETMVSGSNT